jgi:serpin B
MGITHPMDTDPDLIRRYADDGDEAAFAELVQRHLGLVHATALRLLGGDTHLAQDVAQGTFTELARQARTLHGRDTLAGWLHHTARFLALNAVRAERRRREREQEAHAMNETNTTPDAAWAHFAPVLDDAIAALDEADRDALLLRYFQDKSHREVGEQLGLGEDAARMRITRALDKLRAHFSKRGVTTTAALLSLTLGVHGSTPAPAGLAVSVTAKSLAAVAGGSVAVGAAKTLLTAKWFAAAAVVGLAIFAFWPSKKHASSFAINSSAPSTNTATLAVGYESAAQSTNQTGLDLFRLVASTNPGGNVLISPYSIQSALAMTYAGADGETRAEMARVLHLPPDDAPLADSFGQLRAALDAMVKACAQISAQRARSGAKVDVVEWHVANRLFGQTDYEFRQPFLDFTRNRYAAPFQPLDFKAALEPARATINAWVAEQTNDKIANLIPSGGVKVDTRLVLVNALYFKAPWETNFAKAATQDRSFHFSGSQTANVPTMSKKTAFGYLKTDGYTAVTVPYLGGELHLLIVLPDKPDELGELTAKVTPKLLQYWSQIYPHHEVALWLPKFTLNPATIEMKPMLQALGMKSAFDAPKGSANFDRMAPRKTEEWLALGEVYHKTFLSLDEEGTEAAAATAVETFMVGSVTAPPPPPEVHVDRPFLFAIQHRASGLCLFLGRVTDPR